jgi:hypothetical protein
MPAFTLGRLAKLYGMHRSTVYEAVEKGRVSAGLDGKGQRVIDLSEAIRVWGEPPTDPTAKPDTRQPAPPADPTPPPDTLQPLLEELRLLREEVAGLRAELRLIEHKPTVPQPAEPTPEKAVGQKPPSAPAKSFADLLKALNIGDSET